MSDEYYELYQQCKLERDQLKQQLESCQNELSGISGQLKEAVEVIDMLPVSADMYTEKRRAEFLAKYRGEK